MNHARPVATAEILPNIDTVLVTGASGFVGRHLVSRLEAMGKTVVRVSLRDGVDVVHDTLPLDGVGHIFHAAGRTGVPGAWQDPAGYIEVNTLGTARILDQCRRHGCALTFLGAYVYGIPERLPIHETDRVDANNPYALSKYLAEVTCSFYARTFGLSVVMLRLFNIYGPGQSDDFLIPLIVRQILDPDCREIEVMDLTPSRDYVHIADAVEGILQSTRAEAGSVFNLGSGEAHSVEDIIRRASAAAGIEKPYRDKCIRRRNEVDNIVADISRLHEAVGWRPRISLDSGLRNLIEDERKQWQA
jgi:nucleoside-diphosphate-sugar epimerase